MSFVKKEMGLGNIFLLCMCFSVSVLKLFADLQLSFVLEAIKNKPNEHLATSPDM
jgi:hypothetical protein